MSKYAKLIGSLAFLYVFFTFATPYIAQFFPNWQYYYETSQENGLETGALYYTNIPQIYETEQANREAVLKATGSALGWKPLGE